MPIACCVPPEYDVPIVPTLPFDHGCSAIHFSKSAPSGPSSRSGRHVPSDRYLSRTSGRRPRSPEGQNTVSPRQPWCLCCRPSARQASEATGDRPAPPRCIDIRGQTHAVAGRDHDVARRDDLERRLPAWARPCADRTARTDPSPKRKTLKLAAVVRWPIVIVISSPAYRAAVYKADAVDRRPFCRPNR